MRATLALVVALLATGGAAALGPRAPHAEAAADADVVVLDTPHGPRVLERDALAWHEFVCHAQAPHQPSCANGPLFYRGVYVTHGIARPMTPARIGEATYGDVHEFRFLSILTSSAGTERVFQCDVRQLPGRSFEFKCFPGKGVFPPQGTTIEQRAYALLGGRNADVGDASARLLLASDGAIHLPGLGGMSAHILILK